MYFKQNKRYFVAKYHMSIGDEVLELIHQINNNSDHKKRGFNIKHNIESSKVAEELRLSNSFIDDLQAAAGLEDCQY